MLQYEVAKSIYDEIRTKASESTKSGFDEFFKLFLKNAADYASTRTSWAVMSQSERSADDNARRVKHDAFISMLSAISRNLGVEGIEEKMPDRKAKGDFACYIALFMGLEQR